MNALGLLNTVSFVPRFPFLKRKAHRHAPQSRVDRSRHFSIKSQLLCTAEEASEQLKKPKLLFHIVKPLLEFSPLQPPNLPEQWREGRYDFSMKLFGLIPLGWHAIVISYPQADCFTLRDDGYGALFRQWKHAITVSPQAQGCHYCDELQIDAGILTPSLAPWIKLLYRYRQQRLKTLAKKHFSQLH